MVDYKIIFQDLKRYISTIESIEAEIEKLSIESAPTLKVFKLKVNKIRKELKAISLQISEHNKTIHEKINTNDSMILRDLFNLHLKVSKIETQRYKILTQYQTARKQMYMFLNPIRKQKRQKNNEIKIINQKIRNKIKES